MNPETRPRILVVDDEPDQREMIGAWLESTGFQPTLACNGLEALSRLEAEPVDVVVTDLAMPGMGGLQLLTILRELAPGVPVIFLSGRGTIPDVVNALRGGRAYDFLLKPLRDMRQLNLAIERALADRMAPPPPPPTPPAPAPVGIRPAPWRDFVEPSPIIPRPMRESHAAAPAPAVPAAEAPPYVEPLTRTERDIMFLLAQGFDNREIANQLHYSEKTIRNYLSRVYEKLCVGNRLQAVAFCRRHGLIADMPAEQSESGLPAAS